MDWLHHPRFARERSRIIEFLRQDQYDFRKIKKVVFLCGGRVSIRRDSLNAYLERHVPDVLVFYAEAVWAVIASFTASANALAVEEKLAALADIVIVIVESPGTFTEIGAFAISDPLRAKLLPILDVRRREDESFINTGPVRWIDADSKFRPSIWVDPEQILAATDQIEERLRRLPKSTPVRIQDLSASPKHLLFFVCDIVAVFGPCPREHVAASVSDVLGSTGGTSDIDLYLGLGKAMKLLSSFTLNGCEMFFRVLNDGRLVSFQRKRHIDLPTLRSRVLSAMQACSACEPVLAELVRRT